MSAKRILLLWIYSLSFVAAMDTHCLPLPSNNFEGAATSQKKQEQQRLGKQRPLNGRPPANERRFVSKVIDTEIASVAAKITDPNLATLFSNALPNTLDTTVYYFSDGTEAPLDSFIITGDIPAMWLRDSMNQLLPYIPYLQSDPSLQALVKGTIRRHVRSVLIDSYANAFNPDRCTPSGHPDDITNRRSFLGTSVSAMTPYIYERKWELDSLCATLKLGRVYYESTNDSTVFDADWVSAVDRILTTFQSQMQSTNDEDNNGGPEYQFQRLTTEPTDTLSHGRGWPRKTTGMISSSFRGSDDATTFPYLVPANMMAAVELEGTAQLLKMVKQDVLAAQATDMAQEIRKGIQDHAIISRIVNGQPTSVFAYEVDGYGNALFMDDANIPSLLSAPYLGFINASDPLYKATRAAVWSDLNPWFFNGSAAAGIGGPHEGINMVWPMSIIMFARTSDDDKEIANALSVLVSTTAGSGFIHESFNKNDANTYTRPWFAWANSLFGEFVLWVARTRPHLLEQKLSTTKMS